MPSCIYHYVVQKISRLSEIQAVWEMTFFYPFPSKKFMSYAWFLAHEFPPSPSSFALSIFFPSLSPEGHGRLLSRDSRLGTFTHLHHLIYIDNISKIIVDLHNVHLLQATLISIKSKLLNYVLWWCLMSYIVATLWYLAGFGLIFIWTKMNLEGP